ncbi:MAG: hypothetical protein WKG32_12125 [Gemmatimonadaceae bacterium]
MASGPVRAALGAALALVAVSGCTPSLHPLYTELDLTVDRRLIGTWVEAGGDKTAPMWSVNRYGDDAYLLTRVVKRDTVELEARLVKLGQTFFFDLSPHVRAGADTLVERHRIAGHTFGRVWIANDRVRVAALDRPWLQRMLSTKQFLLSHEFEDGNFLITASTATLQKFAGKYADDTTAFARVLEWERKPDAPPPRRRPRVAPRPPAVQSRPPAR